MLLDVTAITASSTLGSVAEAFVMLESFQLSGQSSLVTFSTMSTQQAAMIRAMDVAVAPAADRAAVPAAAADPAAVPASLVPASLVPAADPASNPQPLIGPREPTSRVSATKLASLSGVELLSQLALLDRSQLAGFVTQHPGSVSGLIASPPAASTVATLWAGWPQATRTMMIAKAPQLVGSLEGFPYAARDIANRSYLDIAEDQLNLRLRGGVGRAAKDDLTKRMHMLQQVRDALKVGPSGNSRELVSLDPTGEGRAVVVIGDASTADYVNYLIPGMFSDVDTQIAAFADSSDNIATLQRSWLKRLHPGTPASRLPTVATFAWIGYQTPNIVNVASMELAREGESSLAASIEGLRAERAATGTQPYVAILAHSYGSTAAMLALQDDAVSVDALAIVGSPGSPARSVSELNVTGGNVWVGAAAADPIPQTGLFGSQPLSPAYGAHQFGVNGATDPLTGKAIRASLGHNDYFVGGTESLRNMVLIGIGRGDLVIGDDGRSALTGRSFAVGKAHASVTGPQF